MKHSVFLLRSFTLLVIIASVWCYQTAAVQRSEVTAQVRAEAFEIRKQREAEASKAQPGKYKDGTWIDQRIKGKGKKKTMEAMTPGSTMKRIEERAYFMQEEAWVKDRKPRLIEDSHPHYHYTYGIGDKALDVSEKYGVSIAYSDIKDLSAGYHLRYLYTGDDVEILE